MWSYIEEHLAAPHAGAAGRAARDLAASWGEGRRHRADYAAANRRRFAERTFLNGRRVGALVPRPLGASARRRNLSEGDSPTAVSAAYPSNTGTLRSLRLRSGASACTAANSIDLSVSRATFFCGVMAKVYTALSIMPDSAYAPIPMASRRTPNSRSTCSHCLRKF